MKKLVLSVLMVSMSFAAQAHAEDEPQLASDVAIKCNIFQYDAARTRIPDHPTAELIVKKEALANLETASVALGNSVEGVSQVNFEINKDSQNEGSLGMAFMETHSTNSTSLVLAGGGLKDSGVSLLMYRSANSQKITIAQCLKK